MAGRRLAALVAATAMGTVTAFGVAACGEDRGGVEVQGGGTDTAGGGTDTAASGTETAAQGTEADTAPSTVETTGTSTAP